MLTRYPNEGQPISILEAMGNGMMIVTTEHAGIPDIVKDGVNGIVVDIKKIKVCQIYERLLKSHLRGFECENRLIAENLYNQKEYLENMKKRFENE